MNFEEKVDFLNSLVGETLNLTYFSRWELSSYETDSLFAVNGSIGHVSANTLAECIDKTIEIVWRKINNV